MSNSILFINFKDMTVFFLYIYTLSIVINCITLWIGSAPENCNMDHIVTLVPVPALEISVFEAVQ